jgi:hypothetical protein
MVSRSGIRSIVTGLFVAGGLWLSTPGAFAQTPPAALPTAPGADRAVTTGAAATAAKASLPGDNGSPLEPYLFTFLLAGGGLICAIAVRVSDARVQREYDKFTPEMRRRFMGVA